MGEPTDIAIQGASTALTLGEAVREGYRTTTFIDRLRVLGEAKVNILSALEDFEAKLA